MPYMLCFVQFNSLRISIYILLRLVTHYHVDLYVKHVGKGALVIKVPILFSYSWDFIYVNHPVLDFYLHISIPCLCDSVEVSPASGVMYRHDGLMQTAQHRYNVVLNRSSTVIP